MGNATQGVWIGRGLIVLGVLAVLLVGAATGVAHGSGLAFHDVWARAASEGHMSAVYMKVVNAGDEDVVIVGAASDVAQRVEVHETTMEMTVQDGKVSQVMRMQEIGALAVPAGQSVTLQPGGLHIMLIELTRDIEAGDHFTLALQLEDGRRVELDVPVRVGFGDDAHDDHAHHDH